MERSYYKVIDQSCELFKDCSEFLNHEAELRKAQREAIEARVPKFEKYRGTKGFDRIVIFTGFVFDKPEELDPENAYALGRRFEEERSMKEAIACYTSAYQRGLFQAFEALTDLAQNEYDREYPCAGRIWLRRIPQRSQGGGEGICKCDEGLPPILQSDRVRHLLQGF